jgi:hypothetical protein
MVGWTDRMGGVRVRFAWDTMRTWLARSSTRSFAAAKTPVMSRADSGMTVASLDQSQSASSFDHVEEEKVAVMTHAALDPA